MHQIPRSSKSSSRGIAFAFAGALIALVVLANLALGRVTSRGLGLPDYATWTGVIEIESKLRLLKEFAAQGELDVLIISSSMGDHGISAETLSRELSARHGRPFRVFNFSMGGSDIPTYPIIYRTARLVAKPKEVWLVAPVSQPRVEIVPASLDEYLLKGPLGRYDRIPGLLALSHAFFELPMVRFAPAVRDAVIYRRFLHRASTNLDIYGLNEHGDTLSWVYNTEQFQYGETRAAQRHAEMLSFLGHGDGELDKRLAVYFNARAKAGIQELRDNVKADGASIVIVPIDHAVALRFRDPQFLQGSAAYFGMLAKMLDAPVLDARADFVMQPYMLADPTHLNTIGAREFSKALAARHAGTAVKPPPVYDVSRLVRESAPDPTWSHLTALVPKRADEPGGALELHYLQNWGLNILGGDADVRASIRLPDDREVEVPSVVTAPGVVLAQTVGLPLEGRNVVLRVQLKTRWGTVGDPLPLPLASSRWSGPVPPSTFAPRPLPSVVEPLSPAYTVIDAIGVRWDAVKNPERGDWVGVFPADDIKAPRLTYAEIGGKRSGEAIMRALYTPGKYQLRLFRQSGWELLAMSDPFDVVAVTGVVRTRESAVAAGSPMGVEWSDISSAHAADWIGLFPEGSDKPVARLETHGAKSGSGRLAVPADAPGGPHEVRLLSAGGWNVIGKTKVTVTRR